MCIIYIIGMNNIVYVYVSGDNMSLGLKEVKNSHYFDYRAEYRRVDELDHEIEIIENSNWELAIRIPHSTDYSFSILKDGDCFGRISQLFRDKVKLGLSQELKSLRSKKRKEVLEYTKEKWHEV